MTAHTKRKSLRFRQDFGSLSHLVMGVRTRARPGAWRCGASPRKASRTRMPPLVVVLRCEL